MPPFHAQKPRHARTLEPPTMLVLRHPEQSKQKLRAFERTTENEKRKTAKQRNSYTWPIHGFIFYAISHVNRWFVHSPFFHSTARLACVVSCVSNADEKRNNAK